MNLKNVRFPHTLFITGIDTDAGKSYATGWLAAAMAAAGLSVITQKFVQTGCTDQSEDILIHRQLMGCGLLDVDIQKLTAPEIFTYPCSPDLAARLDGREFNPDHVAQATSLLASKYDHVLLEGAGGLMVPLKGDYLSFDYVRKHNLPVVLVTNGRLGSINHTLLSLHALKTANIPLFAVIYNTHFDNDKTISDDTRRYIQNWLHEKFPETHYWEMPSLK